MLKYRVVLGWRSEFEFDDPDVAMNFAVTAMEHRNNEESDRDNIRIEIYRPEEPEAAND